MEEDYNPSGSVTKVTRNALGGRGIDMISTTQSSTTTDVFPLYDGHGNMVATLARNSGSNGYVKSNERTYDVWGSVRSGSATGDPTKRYCANLGHQADDESDLLYVRARYYEPGSGRFVSEDPAMDGHNWFTYATNNPVSNADPSGKSAADVFAMVVAPFVMLAMYITGMWLMRGSSPASNRLAGAEAYLTLLESSGYHRFKEIEKARKTIADLQKLQSLERATGKGLKRAAWAAFFGYSLVLAAYAMDTMAAFEGRNGFLELLTFSHEG